MSDSLLSSEKTGNLILADVLNPQTTISDLRKTIMACQVMFNAKAYVASPLVLDTQAGYNMPLGRFYVEQDIITAKELDGHLAGLKSHNEWRGDSVELRLNGG